MVGAIKRLNEHSGARIPLDKFYTKTEEASKCINTIRPLLEQTDIIIEPSAGSGSFSKQLLSYPKFFAFDIEPEDDTVSQKDWFTVSRNLVGEGTLLVIGNPPFGVRSDLAKKFINHALKLKAETIAFILPLVFSKALNQTAHLFPANYRLVIEHELPKEAFTVEGNSFHIPCGWYVWTSNQEFLKGVDLRKPLYKSSPDFRFLPRGDKRADFTINGNNGRVKSLTEITNPKAEHYIQVVDRGRLDEIKHNLETAEYKFYSSVNGGVAWIGKQEIIEAYNQNKK